MRTIVVFIIALVLLPSFQLQKTMGNENNPADQQGNGFRFHTPLTKYPALTSDKKRTDIDTNDLKQSSWYVDAIKNIRESEYEIKPFDKSNEFASPNRQQNLRAFYTADKFTLKPRADDKWKIQLTLKGVYSGKNMIYSPQQEVIAVTDKNKIQFKHNNNFIVEYVNNKEGIRQNFIIEKEPSFKPRSLKIKLQTNTGWFINKVHSKEIHFAKNKVGDLENKLTYNDLKVYDANNKSLEASFSVSKDEISINVNTNRAIYPITIDPISTTPSTTLNGTNPFDFFGFSVASAGDVNGDGYSDVIIGARGVPSGTYYGAAYLFLGSSTGLSISPATTLSGIGSLDNFGWSVSSAGDVNIDGYSDVVVGAPGVSGGTGAAYIFLGSNTGLSASPATILNGFSSAGIFGCSVACAGDVNGDGFSDVVIGARQVSSSIGAAYIYLGSSAGLSTSPATILNGIVPGSFGYSVASAGDINGDGYSDVIVGAPGENIGSHAGGAVYLFLGSSTGLSSSPAIILYDINNVSSDFFGGSVASAGDVNGDGYSDIIVGANQVSSSSGAAYLFLGSSTGLPSSPSVTLNAPNAGRFGGSVSSAGDINGDGYGDVIVGTYDEVSPTGAVYLFLGSSTGIPTIPSQTLNGITSGSQFGISISSAGDVNGDGYSDIIIGAPNLSTTTGAAYTYHGSPDGLSTSPTTTINDINNVAGDLFSNSVACAGDVNGDGFSDVIIGAEGVSSNKGAAYFYLGSATGLATIPTTTLNDINNLANDAFGSGVACAGDVNGDGYSDVIVGAPGVSSNKGAAYIYLGSVTGLAATPATTLNDINNIANDYFGSNVASAGDVNGDGFCDVIVGAYGVFSNRGVAYLYLGSAAGLAATPATILNDINNVSNDLFGVRVASVGDVNGDGLNDIIVGAPGVSSSKGAAYLYLGSAAGLATTPATTLNDINNVSFDYFGISVAGAGDVNGDGFSDVIVGAYGVSSIKGAAYLYLGSVTGLATTPSTTLNDINNVANDYFGGNVASSGDVNGDGYSDVIVTAWGVSSNRGAAYLYLGSTTGLATTPATTLNDINNVANDYFGISVACAGDVNGDGYNDVIVGAPEVLSLIGAAYFYYGNSPGGLRNNLRLYNSDTTTPIQQSNMSDPNLFGAGLYAKSFIGKQKGKMVWETVWNGQPFSGNPITNSVNVTASQPVFINLGLTGTELKHTIAKQSGHKATYIRARVKYDPVTAITGQVYGPWRYPESFLRGKRDIGAVALPVKFISFTVVKQNNTALLKWITVDEEPGVQFQVQHSTDGIIFTTLTTINGKNQTQNEYEWLHANPAKGNNFYRIRAVENQKEAYTTAKKLNFSQTTDLSIYPNPASIYQILTIENTGIKRNQLVKISIINLGGQTVFQKEIIASVEGRIILSLTDLPSGEYILKVQAGQGISLKKIIIVGR